MPHPMMASTMAAAARIDANSIAKLRRAAAKTADRGRSSASVQAAAGEFAYATTRPVSSARPVVSASTPSPFRMRERRDRFSGRAKLASVICWPARSITTSPPKPRSIERWLVRDWRNSIAPASTPLTRPLASRVGTAMITTRLASLRVTSPSLMNGFPVEVTLVKYARSATLSPEPVGSRSETREMPSRSIQPSPPLKSGCVPLVCSREK